MPSEMRAFSEKITSRPLHLANLRFITVSIIQRFRFHLRLLRAAAGIYPHVRDVPLYDISITVEMQHGEA